MPRGRAGRGPRHLLKNLRRPSRCSSGPRPNAALKALEHLRGRTAIRAPQTGSDTGCRTPLPAAGRAGSGIATTPGEASETAAAAERFERVHELHERGYPAARIARELGLSRRSVFRYLRRETCPDWHLRGSQRSRLDGYREWIDARIAEGFINIADLHRQLTERGFKGSYGSVYAFITKRLGEAGKKRERLDTATPPVPETTIGKAALLRVGPTTRETQASRTGSARRHRRMQRRAGRGAGPGGRVHRINRSAAIRTSRTGLSLPYRRPGCHPRCSRRASRCPSSRSSRPNRP